jgi:transposase
MDYKIREIKTGSRNTAVQVINYHKRKRNILKHIGTGKNTEEISFLRKQAETWILEQQNQNSFFKTEINEKKLFESMYAFQKIQLTFAYEFLEKVLNKFKFQDHIGKWMQDLVIVQILETGSKRHLVRFLEEQVGISLDLNLVYENMVIYKSDLKDRVCNDSIKIAEAEFNFKFTFVFYDVTTLYFETFKEYEFQKPGFSKDNKANQPQIVIGLVVTDDGFPIHYEVFEGNKAETKTFLPVVKAFKEKHKIENLTVVADAAMFSKMNFDDLKKENINYIVGAKLAGESKLIRDEIEKTLVKKDGSTIRIEELIVEYSEKRFTKNKRDLDKHIERAKKFEGTTTTKLTKLKYLKNDAATFSLNQDLIDKQTKLLGLKGYSTNLKLPNEQIIQHYRNLVNVEHAFRISKSDLEVRPIFHHKEESIRNHILLCFMSLCISKYLELKTKTSIKEVVHQIKSIVDMHILSKTTQRVMKIRTELSTRVKELEGLSH